MLADEARRVLGFPSDARPTRSQIKEAYRRKALESHPDRFPAHQKSHAESKFKTISEAYSCLGTGTWQGRSFEGTTVRVARTGVRVGYKKGNRAFATAPFFFLVIGTVSFACSNATRAYQRQKEACPNQNPFLP